MTDTARSTDTRYMRFIDLTADAPALSILLFLCRTLTGEIIFGLAAISLTLVYAATRWRSRASNRTEFLTLAFVAASMFVFAAGNAEATHFRSLYYFLTLATSAIIAIYCIRQPTRAFYVSQLALLGFLFWFSISAMFKGVGLDAINEFIPDGSRNAVSIVVVVLQIFNCAALYRLRGHLPVLLPTLTLAVAMLCYGRSSLAVAGVLLLLCVVQRISWSMHHYGFTRPMRNLIYGAMAVAACSILFVAVTERPMGWSGGLTTQRWTLIGAYLSGLDFYSFLVGLPLTDVPLIATYTNNPHNSFIRGHSYFGISYFGLIAFVAVTILVGLGRKQWVLVALALLGVARVTSDTFALPGNFDFALFLPLFGVIASGYDEHATTVFRANNGLHRAMNVR